MALATPGQVKKTPILVRLTKEAIPKTKDLESACAYGQKECSAFRMQLEELVLQTLVFGIWLV